MANTVKYRWVPAAAVLAAAITVLVLGLGVMPFRALVALPSDDAFYYFEIARNIVGGQGCTFDGIVATNGFHPLWMLCILPVFALGKANPELPVRIVLTLNVLMALTSLVMLYRLVQRHVAPGWGAVAVGAGLLPNLLNAMTNGMETGVLLLVMVAVLGVCYRYRIHEGRSSLGAAMLFGALLGVASLCRLDSVFLLVAAGGLIAFDALPRRAEWAARFTRLVAMGVAFGVVVSPYVVWNVRSFGHLMPISGAVKSAFPSLRDPLTLQHDRLLGVALLASLIVLNGVILATQRRDAQARPWLRSPLTMLSFACLFHFAYSYLFLAWGVYWWHFALYGLAVALAFPLALHRLVRSRPGPRKALQGVLVAGMITLTVFAKAHEVPMKARQHVAWMEAAHWARENTEPGTVFAIKDAGLFGYCSERPTVNLDGKANGEEYRQYLNRNEVQAYLRKVGVQYLASIHARYVNGESWVVIPRVNRESVVLRMDQTWEVYRSRGVPDAQNRLGAVTWTHFAIWDYRKAQLAMAE